MLTVIVCVQVMAEKLDDIDKQIERELHNLSLDELSTSDADSVADQSLSNSPTKDNVSFQQMYLMIFLFVVADVQPNARV